MTLVLGLIGGIGSGKSTVAAAFERFGCIVLNADRIGHEVLTDPEVQTILQERWGDSIFLTKTDSSRASVSPTSNLTSDQTPDRDTNQVLFRIPDRKKIATLVFGTDSKSRCELEFLNSVVHPRIKKRLELELLYLKEKGEDFVLLDAPLLLEISGESLCNYIIYVDTSNENRLERVKNRGWSREELKNREKNQISLKEKQKKANFVIDNNQTCEKMMIQVASLLAKLKSGQINE